MKYKFCSIRINVIKYDVTSTTKGEVLTLNLSPHPHGYATGPRAHKDPGYATPCANCERLPRLVCEMSVVV